MPADVAALLARYRVDFPEHHRQLPTGHDGSRPRKLIEFERFHAALCAALHGSDEYVWIYTEKPRWWSNDGKLLELPDAYVQSFEVALLESRPEGAATCQPRAPPWESDRVLRIATP